MDILYHKFFKLSNGDWQLGRSCLISLSAKPYIYGKTLSCNVFSPLLTILNSGDFLLQLHTFQVKEVRRMELKIGKMSSKELAQWLGISYSTYKNNIDK